MQQQFHLGTLIQGHCHEVDMSTMETLDELKSELGRTFGFVDATCESYEIIARDNEMTAG